MTHTGKDEKVALVLAGGGLTGAVYEIGALRAIDDLLVGQSVNDLDIYVGTSAGALVASFLVNGLSPEGMLQVIDGSHPEIRPVEARHIFNFNTGEFLHRSWKLPRKLLNAWSHYLRHLNDMTLFDLVWSLLEVLPSGLYDGQALERYIRRILAGAGRSNIFNELAQELYIIATDLDSGERTVFGRGARNEVPISLAVAASSALPLIYRPVRIGESEYVDGGLRGTASLDLAIERGAKLVLCINPLVPYNNRDRSSIPFLGPDGGYLSDKGVQAIAAQISRIGLHSGLHYHIKQLRRAHPDVDILLVEPSPDDYQMFFYNVMRYSARLTIAEHGFETVMLDLAENYADYEAVFARHGISISPQLVIDGLTEIRQSGYDPATIRSVLETRPLAEDRQTRETPLEQLNETLARLDLALDALGRSG